MAELDRRLPRVYRARYAWANYVEVFSDRRTYGVLDEHCLLSRSARSRWPLAFGLPAAWLVERTDIRERRPFYADDLGMLIPGFAAAMGWLFLLHPRIGLANVWLMKIFG